MTTRYKVETYKVKYRLSLDFNVQNGFTKSLFFNRIKGLCKLYLRT